MKKENIKKIVLAYSGGLDTSIIIPWLKENYNNPEIIAVAADVGQGDELEGLEEKALKTGASKLIIADLVDEMCDEIIVPSIMMGAKYEKYLLGTAFARPIIGKKLAEIALAEGADAIAHGCTGKGNDQVRFELAIQYFAPGMPVIAPWREWSIKSRDEEIDYAEAHNVPLKISRDQLLQGQEPLAPEPRGFRPRRPGKRAESRQGEVPGNERLSLSGARRSYRGFHRL